MILKEKLLIMESERGKLRNKIVAEGRSELHKNIKNGNYLEWLKKEYGIMDIDSILLDKEFFEDMKHEIERVRTEKIVYDKNYKESDLNEWRRKNNRKTVLRLLSKKANFDKENEKREFLTK